MKKLLIISILLLSIALFAGTPKNVGTAVEIAPAGSGTAPAAAIFDYQAYVDTRPGEIISVGVLGGMYFEQPTFGMCLINVGNFPTAWAAGDLLVWDYYLDGALAGTQGQVLGAGGSPQYNMVPLTLAGGVTTWNVSGTVLLDGSGLELVEIDYSEVIRARVVRKTMKGVANNSRALTYTAADGTYDFDADDGTEMVATPALAGYNFTPDFYQAIIGSDIIDWDFVAAMNQSGTGTNAGTGTVNVVVSPLELNGVLVDTEVDIVTGDNVTVVVNVANSNPAVPVPANADLSFELDVTGSTGPVTVTLYFPILAPPIQYIVFFDGVSWVPIAGDWSVPGEVTFTYDFSVLRGIETFVVGVDDPLPVTLTGFTAAYFQNEFVNISWTTESETAMNVYNLYRSVEGDENQILIHTENATNTTTTHEYSVEDYEVDNGITYNYWLEAIGNDGSTSNFGPTSVTIDEETPVIIDATVLKGNFPNPFNPQTFIQFDVKEGETATLTIYNIKGEVVEKSNFASDTYNYEWNAEGLSSGVYFYKLSSESYTKTSKMLLLK